MFRRIDFPSIGSFAGNVISRPNCLALDLRNSLQKYHSVMEVARENWMSHWPMDKRNGRSCVDITLDTTSLQLEVTTPLIVPFPSET